MFAYLKSKDMFIRSVVFLSFFHLGILLTLCLLLPQPVFSQSAEDEPPEYILNEVVVVGDRSESVLRESTTATSILTVKELEKIPARNLVDALHYISGLTFVEQDASGHLPMAVVRGFFGGGEAEYILLHVDGIPVNDLRNGLINWNQIPYNEIERIEITRGGGSAMYGDLALGAVINIETRSVRTSHSFSGSFKGGNYNTLGADLFYRYQQQKHQFTLRGAGEQVDGYRDHSQYKNLNLGGSYRLGLNSTGQLLFRLNYDRLDKNDPGPLSEEMVAENRRQSNPLFDDDNRLRNQYDLSLRYLSSEDKANHLSLNGGIRGLNQEQTRTLQLTSEFGDTQSEDQTNSVGWAQFQFRRQTGALNWVGGIDAELGNYDSKYFSADRSTLLSEGDGDRIKTGLYLEGKFLLNERIRATVGARYDWISNRSSVSDDVTFNQFSPRVGINFQYSNAASYEGHIFSSWSRAFKAPTLDQLYDTRALNFFGQEFNFANTALEPQRSNNFDFGIYQQFPLSDGRMFGDISLAAYVLDISNEIDLDLTTFKYGNILKSKHSGVEGSLGFYFGNRVQFNNTVNFMDVTFESGDFEGNQLKNIPKSAITNRLSLALTPSLNFIVTHKFFNEVFLDDANTVTLTSFNVFDSQLQFNVQ